jgi:hypothetical protein
MGEPSRLALRDREDGEVEGRIAEAPRMLLGGSACVVVVEPQ